MGIKRVIELAMATLVVTFFVVAGSAAGAQENPDYTAAPPVVENLQEMAPPVVAVRSAPPASPSATPLPLTGSDVVQLAAIGGLLVAGGAGVMTARRRAA